jgi:hypothetical protein
MEHSKGNGIELNPSENAKLWVVSRVLPSAQATRILVHVHVNLLTLVVQRRLDIEGPQQARNIDGDGRRAKVHPGANTAAPAKSAVTQCARVVVALLDEALGSELVGFGEVCLVQMDWDQQVSSRRRDKPATVLERSSRSTYCPIAAQ